MNTSGGMKKESDEETKSIYVCGCTDAAMKRCSIAGEGGGEGERVDHLN